MTITVKKEVDETVEIKLPSFYKDKYNKFFGLIDEDNIYTVLNGDTFTSIMNGTSESMAHEVKTAIGQTEITEEEFMDAWEKAQKSVYLKPMLVDTGSDEAYNNLKHSIAY